MDLQDEKIAIQAIINGYSGAAGRLDIKELIDFFTEDGEIYGVAGLLGQAEPVSGRDKISSLFSPSFEKLAWLVQQNTTTDINISSDGKTATANTSLVEMAQASGADMIVLIARYDDELRLTESGWRFTKRTLVPHSFKSVP